VATTSNAATVPVQPGSVWAAPARGPGGARVITESVGLDVAAVQVRARWAERRAAGEITQGTEELYLRHLETFLGFAAAHGVKDVETLTARVCLAWVEAPISAVSPGSRGRAGQRSAPNTRRGRQGVLRAVIAVWADRGWVAPDLMPAKVISKAPALGPCPLTPAEATRLRMAGQQSAADSLLPAIVAIALAGASGTEIAALMMADYDADAASLLLPGRGGRAQRTVIADVHAARVISTHLAALHRAAKRRTAVLDPAVTPLALPTAPRTHRSHVTATAVGQHLYRALHVAGINRPGVTPGSMQDFAANSCYAVTNRVEDVADLLGLQSLDAARCYIDRDWQHTWADTIRQQ